MPFAKKGKKKPEVLKPKWKDKVLDESVAKDMMEPK